MIHRIRTIDAHAAGEPLRLIVDGCPAPPGPTMMRKRAWLQSHYDWLRRALMLEPRGHEDMYGAVLTEPVTRGSHAGVLFMHNAGYSLMCGHGIIASVTIALERGLIHTDGDIVALDTPAGRVRARGKIRREAPGAGREGAPDERRAARRTGASEHDGKGPEASQIKVESVAFENVPAFVSHAGVPVRLGSRELRVDVAFGGAFYAIVDAEAAGVPLLPGRLSDLRKAGMAIRQAIEASVDVQHPTDRHMNGLYGTILTGPPSGPGADLRNVAIFADAGVDRSPCGTGTSAVMAVLDAMGLLAPNRDFVHESLLGTTFRGRVIGRTKLGDVDAIVTEIEGSAWITGEHTFLIDDEDPLREGFRI